MTKRKKLFTIFVVGLLLITAFSCSKPEKKKIEKLQTETVLPAEKTIEILEGQEEIAAEKLIDHKITRQWMFGMQVSIPHFSTEEEVRQLNDNLVNTHFPAAEIVVVQYNCLDHPALKPYISAAKTTSKYFCNKEMIAFYNHEGRRFDMWRPLPEERYPNIMTSEEIENLDAMTRITMKLNEKKEE